jgi:hypothetical protein
MKWTPHPPPKGLKPLGLNVLGPNLSLYYKPSGQPSRVKIGAAENVIEQIY